MTFRATYKLPSGEQETRPFEFGYDATDLVVAEARRLAGPGEELVGEPYRVIPVDHMESLAGETLDRDPAVRRAVNKIDAQT